MRIEYAAGMCNCILLCLVCIGVWDRMPRQGPGECAHPGGRQSRGVRTPGSLVTSVRWWRADVYDAQLQLLDCPHVLGVAIALGVIVASLRITDAISTAEYSSSAMTSSRWTGVVHTAATLLALQTCACGGVDISRLAYVGGAFLLNEWAIQRGNSSELNKIAAVELFALVLLETVPRAWGGLPDWKSTDAFSVLIMLTAVVLPSRDPLHVKCAPLTLALSAAQAYLWHRNFS